MSAQPTLAACGLFLTLVFAGCAGGDAKSGADASPGSDIQATSGALPDAGAVVGRVVDDTVQPIAGAQVSLIELAATAASDAEGGFRISNVAPGKYKLAAAALGYESIIKFVEVLANEDTTVTITLVAIAIEEVGYTVWGPLQGYFECRLGYRTPTGASTGPCPVVPTTNDKSSQEFKMQNHTKAFVGEMRWNQGSYATSQRLRLSFSYIGRPSMHWWCTATSKSPITWIYTIDQDDAGQCLAPVYCGIAATAGASGEHDIPRYKDRLQAYTNTPFGCTDTSNLNPVELSLQQKFEIIVTTFEGSYPPEGYSAFNDG